MFGSYSNLWLLLCWLLASHWEQDNKEKVLKAKDATYSRLEYIPAARTSFDTFYFEIKKESAKSFPFPVNWKTNGTQLFTNLTDCPIDNVIVQVCEL